MIREHSLNSVENKNIKKLEAEFSYVREKTVLAFKSLECNYLIPNTFFGKIKPIEKTFSQDKLIMSLSIPDFLKLAASTINRNYSGDPLALQSFIDSVNLLKALATTNELKEFLTTFILSKLEGKAREAIEGTPGSAQEIVENLKGKIKCESSKIIEGRMRALNADRTSISEFAKQAEDLAENLKRSLVMEGISSSKANEMTIEKTVEMCRQSARTDLVKSVLAATKFSDPKEVVAKYIIEINTESKERQILAYKVNRNRNRNQNFNSNISRGGRYDNYRTAENRSNNNISSVNRSFNNNYNSRNSSQPNGNYASRNFYRSNGNNNFRNNQSNYNVRYMGNEDSPQETLGEEINVVNQNQWKILDVLI